MTGNTAVWAAQKRVGVIVLVTLTACAIGIAGVSSAPAEQGTAKTELKAKNKKKKRKASVRPKDEVLFVGNNWEGTADVLRFRAPSTKCVKRKGKKGRAGAVTAKSKRKRGCRKTGKKQGGVKAESAKKRKRGKRKTDAGELKRIARLNIIPDYDQRIAEITTNPVRLLYFLAIRQLVGEGNDQFVDDMYSSKDGELLIVSRPSFADVVAIRVRTGEIAWRFVVDGQRSDHMAISPNGRNVAVSASTGNVVHILDTATGVEVGRFESGDSPHENTYSEDGKRIYHASIGLVYTPADQPVTDTTKGERYFQVVDSATNTILKRVDMGQKLAEAGHPNMSSAVRPMALTRDEHFVYLQVSFFHGFVEYDLRQDRVTRLAHLPVADHVKNTPREEYLLDSAHHGIAINGKGSDLCVAGTMSDYAAIVSRKDPRDFKIINGGLKPYWSTSSDDGDYCYVSWSGSDRISVLSYRDRREVARIQVGDHPQRIRTGTVPKGWPTGQ